MWGAGVGVKVPQVVGVCAGRPVQDTEPSKHLQWPRELHVTLPFVTWGTSLDFGVEGREIGRVCVVRGEQPRPGQSAPTRRVNGTLPVPVDSGAQVVICDKDGE